MKKARQVQILLDVEVSGFIGLGQGGTRHGMVKSLDFNNRNDYPRVGAKPFFETGRTSAHQFDRNSTKEA